MIEHESPEEGGLPPSTYKPSLDDIAKEARECRDNYEKLLSSYRVLVQYIHTTRNDYDPKRIREVLSRYLPKTRISELLRVAYSTDDICRDYLSRVTGFRAALARVRARQHNERLVLRWAAEFERLNGKKVLEEMYLRNGQTVLIVLNREGTHSKTLGNIHLKSIYTYEKAGNS